MFNFVERQVAIDAATEVLGPRNFRRILVLPRIAEGYEEEINGLAEQHQVVILEWRQVLQYFIENTDRRATNESENVIRALLVHGEGAIFRHQLGVGQ